MPTLQSREPLESANTVRDVEEGYVEAKFNTGQTTGRKLDGETVAREMRRSVGADGKRLFRVSEF